ncbi:hypothetical protein AAE02nite_20710 [Adhaeribacter aerolatus]|uniref:Glycoside hydrolase family 65 n=1 Tax=Adhaeribacter aerolatus TaxID=670289 RepID=A0A512AY11_9BACT|nr:hypothetical protein [Adhaeribacter aerolatus]GEO04407.1 hypothetical protein AAE02nite_20710 [Adhaeribacter aerolatus]
MKPALLILLLCLNIFNNAHGQSKIDRQAVVARHHIKITKVDSLASLTVGNGRFAFTADVTGLQTFPENYQGGVALGTQSEWGWHSWLNTENYKFEETLQDYNLNGKKVSYSVQVKEPKRKKDAADYFRINQHRLQLGNIGLEITKEDGSLIKIKDVKNSKQELNLWKGQIMSHFQVEGVPVEVITYGHADKDAIAAKITSPLIRQGRLKIKMRLPYPNGAFKDVGNNYASPDKHQSIISEKVNTGAIIKHALDTTTYYLVSQWQGNAELKEKGPHYFTLTPDTKIESFSFSVLFTPEAKEKIVPDFTSTQTNSQTAWKKFWQSGGAVDFAGSTDPRAKELERRVVLSQYLTRVQCAGNYPPQETGLTYNSWYGKPHLEMFWWHAAHFALWNRTELLEKSLDWYFRAEKEAKALAKRQGYEGLRWQKMVDHDGREAPSSVGAFLVWQQPHFIYLAELVYRNRKDKKVLDKYKDLLFATADFMASYPAYDKQQDRYNLGKGLIPAQECFDPLNTFNPTYELAYWDWALNVAQEWRTRLGMPRKKEWDEVLAKLASLPQNEGVYLATESTLDSYSPESKFTIDHPAVLAAFSTIPASHNLSPAIMNKTFDTVWKVWHWDHTWGWDFPMVAMTAARLNKPNRAIDALFMKQTTNTYLPNGHNYQDKRLTIYLPGNGGILSAVAMMCAGFTGSKGNNPGFPKDGSWKVKWEGLNPMP